MNVAELIRQLEEIDGDTEVRIAHQPNYPLQYHVGGTVEVKAESQPCPDPQDFAHEEDYEDAYDAWELDSDRPDQDVVYIAEGGQVYEAPYLPYAASNELGWR